MRIFNYIVLVVLLSFISGNSIGQNIGGKVFDNLKLKSSILNKEVNYAIYLPFDYDISERSYPVLYLLHGYGDDQTGWVQFGEVKMIADEAIAKGLATSMIIVMPDAEKSWYVNDYKGEFRYEDFFIKEFIPAIESKYRCRAEKKYRAVAGLSMGGYGSLLYALKYPDMFAACCPLSAAVLTDEEILESKTNKYRLKTVFGGEVGKSELTEYWKKNSILNLVRGVKEDQRRAVRYYVDCGDDDFLYKGNAALFVAMRDAKIWHEFRMRDGGHIWSYWRSALPSVLEFVSQSFCNFFVD